MNTGYIYVLAFISDEKITQAMTNIHQGTFQEQSPN